MTSKFSVSARARARAPVSARARAPVSAKIVELETKEFFNFLIFKIIQKSFGGTDAWRVIQINYNLIGMCENFST